jgi:hypothetical protein
MTERAKQRRWRFPEMLVGLELDDVLEEHEHTGDVQRVDVAQSGANFVGRKHRQSAADRIAKKRTTGGRWGKKS